jgi:putative methylase
VGDREAEEKLRREFNLWIADGRADGLERHHLSIAQQTFERMELQPGERVLDLGCGTGILTIGAALLGAASVTGVDIDEKALAIARKNADLPGEAVTFLAADLRDGGCRERIDPCDTVVMNPPFGAQKAHADRPFIDCALAVAPVTYSIFNAGSLPFVEAYTAQKAEITEKVGGSFPIKRTFAFHTKDVQEIEVEIVRLKRIV